MERKSKLKFVEEIPRLKAVFGEHTCLEKALLSYNQPWHGKNACCVASWVEKRSDGFRRFAWLRHAPVTYEAGDIYYSRWHACLVMGHDRHGHVLFDAIDLFDDRESVDAFRMAYAGINNGFNQTERRLLKKIYDASFPSKTWRQSYMQKFSWLTASPDWKEADQHRKLVAKGDFEHREKMRFYPRVSTITPEDEP